MVFDGYMKLGGVEIANSERIRGYAETSDCHLPWFTQGPACESLQDALGDEPYTASNLPLAPWYDQSLPDLSGRFLGVYGLQLSGLDSSTRSTQTTEGIDDGGTIGSTRKGMLSARMRATLVAEGRDALDYGVHWLNAAMDTDRCGQHGAGCGTTDMEFLTDCPPERGEVEEATEIRRNLIERPTPVDASDWYFTGGTRALDSVFTRRPGVPTLRRTLTSAASTLVSTAFMLAPGLTSLADGVPVVEGETYTVSGYVSASVDGYESIITVFWADSAGGTLSVSEGDFATGGVVGQWQRPSATAVAPAGAAYAIPYLGVKTASGLAPVGTQVWLTDGLMEVGDEVGDWFSGDSPPPDSDHDYAWTGDANSSESVMRSLEMRPQTDEEYAVDVDEFRRFLHDVTVTSGPLVVDEHVFRHPKGYYGLTMEWTVTSERAWIYSKTRPVELPVTPTVVIQDTPFNLVPHPSAELAGPDMVAATNYSLNPSLEANATGWLWDYTTVSGGDVSSYVEGGRVTNELQAVGAASFRVRANLQFGPADGKGRMRIWQDVDISTRPANSRVSLSIWSALLALGGSPENALTLLGAKVQFLNGGTELSTVSLGQVTGGSGFGGRVFAAQSLAPPAGAKIARVLLEGEYDWVGPADIRMYADALAVTVP